ncbi:hypothetical protein FLA105534_01014 [Flavobacterium bizetiae]|uniref:DUF4374 domain-containing protein n=1 Tax=Flavobacterium bizetiae TaxID=2704140 RepID=A0A6J4GD49_9FLAO|nr:DUF4374 domain-containing protein [Flavobacterium bizetiae]CAA9196219.1 hypothetical protein FLA105534_01014 [Flavobacterium bizetiae]CAD5341011.1 hypothetical protein FLA105535_00973 [Flavobacterium bizetiae]CAD5347308.1 hypothetical protein FLA105534_01263 [Flavobacterium bizetiae]
MKRFIKPSFYFLFLSTLIMGITISCSSNDDSGNNDNSGDGKADYALWLQLGSWPNTTQYIVGVDDLTKGTVSLVGNGAEVTSKADYGIIAKNGFYYYPSTSSNFGKMTKFEFKNNQLAVVKEVPFTYQKSITNYAWVDDNTLLLFGTNGDGNKVLYTVVNATTLEIKNGELALPAIPTGYTSYSQGNIEYSNGKIYIAFSNMAVWPALAESGMNIAVVNYPSFAVEKIIKSSDADGKGGSNMWMPTSCTDESGDVYMMFFADWMTPTTSPTKVFRIKKGASALDTTYNFDLGTALGGETASGLWYVGNGKAIVKYLDSKIVAANPSTLFNTKFALINVATGTVIKKLDLPADKGSQLQNVITSDGKVFIQVNAETTKDYIWEVNTTTGAVTSGVEIVGGYDYILRLDNLK